MGDSDEEYDRRRSNRDKFQKERNDFQPPQQQQDRRRDFMDNRRGSYQQQPRDYGNRGNIRNQDMSPPVAKRPRRDDWGEDSYDPQPRQNTRSGGRGDSTPILMTFKQFLASQDDSITDEDAISKYQDYKMEYKRTQLHSFFVNHKDEEWFRLKYHPEDAAKQDAENLARIKRRWEVFQELLEDGWMDRAGLDHTNGRNLIRLMDAFVVKLEGGTDEDLALLEQEDIDDESGVDSSMSSEAIKEKPAKKEKSEDDGEKEVDGEESEDKKKRDGEEGALSDSDSEKEAEDLVARQNNRRKPVVSAKDAPQMLLHKTASIFLRNLSPAITKQEVETLAQRHGGFLRVGLADPLPERKYYRRGWVSYRRDVNIKEICWNMNSVRLRDCDLGAIVNRDLTRRVRTANGITGHKQVSQNDLRMAAKLVKIFDKKAELWMEDQATANGNEGKRQFDLSEFEIDSKNPLLQNITDYLIEEASAEEEELLGTGTGNEGEQKITFEKDPELLKVLDKIILYLRLVHSVDYYNAGEYPHEDEMPNRCGLIHVRGPPSSSPLSGQDESTGQPLVAASFVSDFMKGFETKLDPLLNPRDKIPDDEAVKLGKKDPEKEVEAFITANCQELAKDKWLCPLSGKKFKGPEFVRKHILNKHNEKLDEVRMEVTYFNNYLYDPKRPGGQDPRPPLQTPSTGQNYGDNRMNMGGGGGGGDMREGYGGYNRDNRQQGFDHYNRPQQNYGTYNRGYNRGYHNREFQRRDYGNRGGGFQRTPHIGWEGRRDPREQITYKDLDAPEDTY